MSVDIDATLRGREEVLGPLLGRHDAGNTCAVLNLSTGESIAEVGRVTAVAHAMAAADRALPRSSATPPRQRSEVLGAAYELMLAGLEPLAPRMSLEMGTIRSDVLRTEVRYAAEFFHWFAEEAVRIGGELCTVPSGANRILTVHRPVGVALLLTLGNFPAAMTTRTPAPAPALAAGCTALFKGRRRFPAHRSPAGRPPGPVQPARWQPDRPDHRPAGRTRRARSGRSPVRKLSFTGFNPVGRALLHLTADGIVNISLELGGNAPFIVLEDAHFEDAVAFARMHNDGQVCTAANRFLVQSADADDIAELLGARMAALTVGPGMDESTQLGPMVNARRRRDLVTGVDSAIGEGAKIDTGGALRQRLGFFYPATVLGRVDRESVLSAEETFGPVAPVIEVVGDDVIGLANAAEYGLAAYAYSGDLARALSVAEQLQAGTVGVKDVDGRPSSLLHCERSAGRSPLYVGTSQGAVSRRRRRRHAVSAG